MQTRRFTYSGGGWLDQPTSAMDSEHTLVLAFAGARFGADPAPLHELRQRFPRAHLMGCSTAGEIHGTQIADDGIAVAVTRFEHTRVRLASRAVTSSEVSWQVGAELAQQLVAPDLVCVFVLSDGLGVNGSRLVRGLTAGLPPEVVVTGGLAGDGDRFKQTWTLGPDGPQPGLVSAVGLYGSRLRVGHGSHGGWDKFGPERRVTRASANVLYELDGRPALELYKHYLGDRAQGLPATALLFPLALRMGDAPGQVVRTILAVDEVMQSMTFAGDVPEGAMAQLMRANFDRLIQGAADAALDASLGATAAPLLAIAISCVGRRLVLGERAEEEVECVQEALPRGSQQVGFYSYGEIAPHGEACDLHNQTMTITTLQET